jgi:hypothetical protein
MNWTVLLMKSTRTNVVVAMEVGKEGEGCVVIASCEKASFMLWGEEIFCELA